MDNWDRADNRNHRQIVLVRRHLLAIVAGVIVVVAGVGPDFDLWTPVAWGEPPTEVVQASPPALPDVAGEVRAGHWVHGSNGPWDNYGGDFGANLWGYRGLANQGPAGWRRETRGRDDGARRLFWARRADGGHAMGVEVALDGPSSSALVFYKFDEPATKRLDETIDLSGQTICAEVYLPAAIAGPPGPPSAPTGVLLFLQDARWRWAQTAWTNITTTDRWIRLCGDVDVLAAGTPDWDRTRVRTIGVKVGVNSLAAGFSYHGPFFIDNVFAITAPEIQFDFERPLTRTEMELHDIAALGVKALRWWIFADGRAGLRFDENGFVVGLDDAFLADIDELIRLARSARLYLVPVLFDFLLGAEPQVVDGVQTFGRADLITDPAKRRSLLENAVAPVLNRLSAANEVLIIDLFNEPEWLLRDGDIEIPTGKRPREVRSGGIVDLDTMKNFLREVIALIERRLGRKPLLTVGSAGPRWASLWSDLGLRVSQHHLWHGAGQIDDGRRFDYRPEVIGVTRPALLGEYSTRSDLVLHSQCDFLENALANGFTGAFPWAYRAKDDASVTGFGEDARRCLSSFASEHRDLVEFRATLKVRKTGRGNGRVTSAPAGIDCRKTCAALFERGTSVTLTATPAPGHTFTGWAGGGCSGTGTCTVVVTANVTVAANFQMFILKVLRTGLGTVTSAPTGIDCRRTCRALFERGTSVTLTATPPPGHTFTGWAGGGCSGTGTCTVVVTANVTVTANFQRSPNKALQRSAARVARAGR